MATIPPLVQSAKQAQANILSFEAALQGLHGEHLRGILSSFVSWYAMTIGEGDDARLAWAPSKWAGYEAITPGAYVSFAQQLNGRDTENVLSRWFEQPTPLEERRLLAELSTYLARFGKAINKRARVSTLGGRTIGESQSTAEQSPGVMDALMILYETLSDAEKNELRRRIKA